MFLKDKTMMPLIMSWIPMADIKYCQVINILPFNSKFSSVLVLKEMLQLMLFDLVFNNSYKYSGKH